MISLCGGDQSALHSKSSPRAGGDTPPRSSHRESAIRNPRSAMARRCRAFTLIEVLLAVGLTMGIVLTALAFYRQIISTREAFEDRLRAAEVASARRAVMDRMTDELRSAIAHPFLQMGMVGDANGVQFIIAQLPGQDVWREPDMTDEPPEPQQDLRIVGWRLRVSEDPYTGERYAEGIERTEQKLITAQTVEEGVEVQSTLIARGFGFLSLRYWDNEAGQWLTQWDGDDLPMAVRIVLGVEPLPEGVEDDEEYPFETFRRIVYVPAGKTPFGGSAILRGAGGRRP
jgi:type II secretory pathway pseudopilin PulG